MMSLPFTRNVAKLASYSLPVLQTLVTEGGLSLCRYFLNIISRSLITRLLPTCVETATHLARPMLEVQLPGSHQGMVAPLRDRQTLWEGPETTHEEAGTFELNAPPCCCEIGGRTIYSIANQISLKELASQLVQIVSQPDYRWDICLSSIYHHSFVHLSSIPLATHPPIHLSPINLSVPLPSLHLTSSHPSKKIQMHPSINPATHHTSIHQ